MVALPTSWSSLWLYGHFPFKWPLTDFYNFYAFHLWRSEKWTDRIVPCEKLSTFVHKEWKITCGTKYNVREQWMLYEFKVAVCGSVQLNNQKKRSHQLILLDSAIRSRCRNETSVLFFVSALVRIRWKTFFMHTRRTIRSDTGNVYVVVAF